EQHTTTIPTSAVRNTRGRSGPQGLEEPTFDEVLRELCVKYYHQLLPLIAEKMQKEKEQQDKLNTVKACLLYGDESERNPRNHEESHYSESKTPTARTEPRRRHGRVHRPEETTDIRRMKTAREITRNPNQRGTSQTPTKMISLNLGRMRKETLSHLGSGISIFQGQGCLAMWAMPTWCNMFNSTLTGNDRVWFDKLPKESIDSYEDLRAAFRENYLQQTKHIKDPVEIHHIKQRNGESTEDFMERYKAEVLDITTTSLQGEFAAFSHSQKKHPRRGGNQKKETSQISKRVSKTRKGRIRSQIAEEADRRDDQVRQIVVIHQRIKAERQAKGTKEGGNGRKRQAPSHLDDSTMGEGEEDGTEGPMIIEAEIGGHFVHRIYVDGGASSEVLYEHCLVRLRPEIRSQMIPATTSLIRFSGETIWPIGQISLLVTISTQWNNRQNGYKKDPCRTIHAFKCFLDAYKGYHQIKMAEEDEEKTAFIMSQVIFCYTKMPFDLKNAGASYQRLVDRAFQKQIGRNLEVYVDDLVIKSHTEEEIIRDIEETFKTLRKINMKLNPKKCTFGIQEGMFLGYKVNAEGLKVCPDKADAVLSLPSSGCLKDVQRLNGKLASLNKFLSKSAEKSLSFFKTLKKCTKKSDFQWTQEAEIAFKHMKKLIAELPMLAAPKEKEELIIYLAAAKEAISAVLMTERGGKQLPVYFVSRALRGPEINYTSMEKLVLAFLSISGRMLKWKFELEGYDIQYRPMTSIKGQMLAEFIVERPDEESPDEPMAEPEELPEPWTLFTDGSSCIYGSGAGLILTNPEGVEFTYQQCFASVKHPQANGLVERANRSLGEGIKARLDERSKDWI
ncbi:reverse transcriptase domain-containing protein, partial [Tanacetum coccineum]